MEDVHVALRAKGLVVDEETEKEDQMALELVILEGSKEIPYERSAIRLLALEHIVRSAPVVIPGRISTQDLVRLLERVPAGLG